MHFLYSVLTAAGMLVLLPYFLFQGLRTGKYVHNLRERLGYLPAEIQSRAAVAPGAIWIHAVSVGEALAALPLARQLKERFPDRPLFVSTTTATGQQLSRQRMDFTDGVFYFPLDWTGPVRRVLGGLRPAIVVILETEIWPNFLRESRRAGVPVVFVNGRISDRSFRRYRLLQRYAAEFLARVLDDAELFLTQSEEDARRLGALGAPASRVAVTGNLKYDLAPPPSGRVVSWLEEQLTRQERWPLVVAGSVVAEEELDVLSAFDTVQRKWNHALLVLAPRKPERFAEAASIVAESGWNLVRRSQMDFTKPLPEDTDVLLLDNVGELAGLYRLADAVFVGGSLVPAGGHNILEPAWFSKPPVFGPSMENFKDMARQFLEALAGFEVHNAGDLGARWVQLIEDTDRRERMGRAARKIVERNRGATERNLERIAAILATRRSRA